MDKLRELFIENKVMLGNVCWRALQTFGVQGITFLFFLICAHYFTPYEFGIYNYVLTGIFFLITFVDFGVSRATSRYVAEYNTLSKTKLKESLLNSGLIILCLSVIVLSITLLFGKYFFEDYYQYLLILTPLLFFYPVTALLDGIYNGLKRFREASIISVSVGILCVIMAFFLIRSQKISGAFISWIVLYFVLAIVLFLRTDKNIYRFNKELVREVGAYSLVIGVSGMAYFFSTKIDLLFIGHFDYINEVGYYEINNKILLLLLTPLTIIGKVISPYVTEDFAGRQYVKVLRSYIKFLIVSVVLSIALILLFVLLRNFVFEQFLSKYYTDVMKQMLTLMLPYFFMAMLIHITSAFAIATGHGKFCMWFILIVGFINIVFDYICISLYGFWGMIYSTIAIKCISYTLFIILYYRILKKIVDASPAAVQVGKEPEA